MSMMPRLPLPLPMTSEVPWWTSKRKCLEERDKLVARLKALEEAIAFFDTHDSPKVEGFLLALMRARGT